MKIFAALVIIATIVLTFSFAADEEKKGKSSSYEELK